MKNNLQLINLVKNNQLTDSQLSCYYQDIPEIFTNIDRLFKELNITQQDSLALECDNSLPSAIILLELLENKYSFLLLPKKEKSSNPQDIPKFCKYKISTETNTNDGDSIDLKKPDRYIKLTENKNWHNQLNSPIQKLYLQTSGSTGKPKLVQHSHDKLRQNILNCVKRLNLQNSDRVSIPVPIYHMYGLGAAFLPSLAVGASIDLQKNSNLLTYLQREKQFEPNIAFMTPIFAETLIRGRRSNRNYKLTIVAGDLIEPETLNNYQARMGCIVQLYGSTELGAIAAGSPQEPSDRYVGKPMSGVELRLSKTDDPDKLGVGELWCNHSYGFDAYVDENGQSIELTEGDRDAWFRTKDLATISKDGYLEVLGRADFSVNRDGLLVFFSEVEKAIKTILGIDNVVVVSQGKSKRGKGIIAFCVLEKGKNITEEQIRESCFDLLPKRAIPDRVCIINSFPLLPNGKIDRQKLVAKIASC